MDDNASHPDPKVTASTRVLVVEDDERDFVLIESHLTGADIAKFEVDWVSSYDRAEKEIKRQRHHAYLIDHRLGTRDGLELIDFAHRRGYECPLILMTGQNNTQLGFEAIKRGASDYLSKSELSSFSLGRIIHYSIERLKLAERIRRNERLAVVGEATASISHYIKNISQHIISSFNVIEDHFRTVETTGDVDKAWGIFSRSVDDIYKLSKDLLAVSGESSPTLLPHSIREIVEDVHGLCEMRIKSTGMRFEVEPINDLPYLTCDAPAIKDMLLNLITNAIDAVQETDSGRVGIGVTQDSDRNIAFKISDNGPGIPTEIQETVFNPFFTTKGYSGSGLGLTVVRKIVSDHGGRIQVSSMPGRTIFTVLIPVSVRP